jgi:hypothetical protein
MIISQSRGARGVAGPVRKNFHSSRDVMIKIRRFVNGWSEPLPPYMDQVARTTLGDRILDKIKTR